MVKLLRLILALILIPCTCFASIDNVYVDGYEQATTEILDFPAVATPATSTTNSARLYYNPNTDKLKLSVNGGAFADIATGSAAHDAVTVTDSDTIDFTLSVQDITAIVKTDSIDDTHIDWGTGANQVNTDDIPISKVGTPTYDSVYDYINSFGSTGRKTGGVMTDGGSNNITVTGGTGFIKATDDDNAQLLSFDFPANTNITIPGNSTRYIGVEYNSGTPQIVARTSFNWNLDSEFSLGRVINENINGTDTLHIINNPWWVTDGMTNIIERLRGFGRIKRDENVGGLALAVTGTRNIAVTAGTLWSNLNEFSISALDTSSSGHFELYWYKSGTGWQCSDATQYSVTQWNDVTQTTLQTINNKKFCNVWVYVEADDLEVAVLYPQAQYNTAAAAEATGQPSSVPSHIAQNGILIGRIIIKQGTDTPIAVQSAFGTSFSASVVTDHGNLSGLSDDDHTQYLLDTQLSDAAYDAGTWDNNTDAATKNAIRDKIESIAAGATGVNETYGAGWNADTNAPEKDDVYDYLHLLDTDDDGDIDTIDSTLWATKQAADATLTDIADGTIAEDLVNTANPWADNEVADTLTLGENSVISNGASAVPNAAGEIGIDTTDDQFKYYGGASRILPYYFPRSATIPAMVSTDANSLSIGDFPYAVTLKSVGCNYNGTTAPATVANFTLTYGNGTAFTHATPVCTNQTTACTYQAITGGSLAAGQRVYFNITNAATANYTYGITYTYQVDAQ